jgi:hypothetical protein
MARPIRETELVSARTSQLGVVGNTRLTALTGALLLVLLLIELVTVPDVSDLLAPHVFVGTLLLAPLVLKLASTGYRALRYYLGGVAYVRAGPPPLPLRLLAPVLVADTVVLFGTGIALLATGPTQDEALRFAHVVSFMIWLPLAAVHVVAHLPRTAQAIADDWGESAPGTDGHEVRLALLGVALLAGVGLAALVQDSAAPWIVWAGQGESGPRPFIVGLVVAAVLVAAIAVLGLRPLRWSDNDATRTQP